MWRVCYHPGNTSISRFFHVVSLVHRRLSLFSSLTQFFDLRWDEIQKTDRKPDQVQRTNFNLLASTTKKRSPDWRLHLQNVLPNGSTHGVLYGLPKVHKTGCPIRPIVSSTNTYNYTLGSYLVGVLQPISTNCFSAKDSFRFVEWAKQYSHNGEFMCSFDVSSLFTYVPLDETIQICLDKLYALENPPL